MEDFLSKIPASWLQASGVSGILATILWFLWKRKDQDLAATAQQHNHDRETRQDIVAEFKEVISFLRAEIAQLKLDRDHLEERVEDERKECDVKIEKATRECKHEIAQLQTKVTLYANQLQKVIGAPEFMAGLGREIAANQGFIVAEGGEIELPFSPLAKQPALEQPATDAAPIEPGPDEWTEM